MVNDSKIFLGNTPARSRTNMAKVFKEIKGRYERLIIPACGQFSMAFVALSQGWTASQVIAGDVSLFSTVLARGIQGKSIEDLNILVRGQPAPADPAECLYLLKLALFRYQQKHYYQKLYVRDMVHRKDDHVKKIQEDIDAMKALEPMQYETVDMFEQIEKYADDDWVYLADIFGPSVPPAVAKVLGDALAKMKENGDISDKNKWQLIEFLAADYLAK